MSDTIFYTEVDAQVKNALNARKNYYKSENRNSAAHKWLFQKMAYATAQAVNEVSKKSFSLVTPQKGGLGKVPNGIDGLYENPAFPTSGYSDAGRFIPKPHINTVKVSNEGDFGSIRKCEIAFTVYSRADLNSCQPFLDLGANLSIQWGWNDAGGAGGPQGNFTGIIYNFSYSVNSNGGFDCISYGMGKGINILSGNVNAGSDSAGHSSKDKNGNEVKALTISSEIDQLVQKATSLASNSINSDGIGAVKFPTSWGSNENSTQNQENKNTVKEEDSAQYYISLEKITELINKKVLQAAGGPKFDKLTILCNKDVTKCNVPTTDKLVSGHPLEVLFPGFGDYGTHKFFSADYSSDVLNGDLSKAMINVNWLKKLLSETGTLTADYQKSPDKSIGKFFKNLLEMIYINSGERFKLAVTSNPKNENECFISDTNYIEHKIIPYEITAVLADSICRSVSLTAKVPSEMATAAFVANSNTLAPMGVVTQTANEAAGAKASTTTAQEDFNSAKKNIDANPTPDNVKLMQAAIKRLYIGDIDALDGKPKNEAVPFPLDFSCTLDGIEGFIFGNAITCNYLPTIYRKDEFAFTVTKVEQNIASNDWTTTLSTVMRSLPK